MTSEQAVWLTQWLDLNWGWNSGNPPMATARKACAAAEDEGLWAKGDISVDTVRYQAWKWFKQNTASID